MVDSDDSPAGFVFDRFTTLQIVNDITSPSEAAFELGDDGSWKDIETFVRMGAVYKVFVNNRLRLTGRVELNDVPVDAAGGTAIRFTVRTKLADALYSSANPNLGVQKTTLKAFILSLYKPLGYAEEDFIFDQQISRDLMTGKPSQGAGPPPADLAAIEEDQAKPNPPETIFECADRHLRRFGFMHWDSPDGRIVVGAPNDEQDPLYHFRMFRGPEGRINNILALQRVRDFSEIPGLVAVIGTGGKAGFKKKGLSGFAFDNDVSDAGFARPITILTEGIRTQAMASAAARRELSARSRRKSTFRVTVDGLSYWDGREKVDYGTDTVADIVTDLVGGPVGSYFIHRVGLSRTPADGDIASLDMVERGIWRL